MEKPEKGRKAQGFSSLFRSEQQPAQEDIQEQEQQQPAQEPVQEHETPEAQQEPEPEQPPRKTRGGPQQPNKDGYLRCTIMLEAELLPQVKELAELAEVDLKYVFNTAIKEYLKQWTPQRKAEARRRLEQLFEFRGNTE